MLTALSPRKTCWSRSMVRTSRCSVISLTVRVLGTATSMPDCSTGALIMNMTRSTSTTSTSGVMLMSAREERVWPPLLVKATLYPLRLVGRSAWAAGGAHGEFFEGIKQFAAKVVGGRCEDADACGELVVRDHSGHSDKETSGGGDKCFRDAGCNGSQRGSTGGAKAMKRVDNAHHCSKKADERAGCGDGGEPGEATLEAGDGFAGRGLCRALERAHVAGGTCS